MIHSFTQRLLERRARLRRVAAETVFAVAVIGGWVLLTAGLAALFGTRVWLFSSGLLLLSGCGWKFLYQLARDGLYVLNKRSSGS